MEHQLSFSKHYQDIFISPYSRAVCFLLVNKFENFDKIWIDELSYLVRTQCKNEEKINGVLKKLDNTQILSCIHEFAQNSNEFKNNLSFTQYF